ncbi:MAG: phage capsid protein [Ruminococcaceae bacterium]|nr:phage capsid protein [Oscillospiraceae bacterium]
MKFFNSFSKKAVPFNFKTAAVSVFNLDIPSSDSMSDAVSLWTDMYQNNSPWLSENTKSLSIAAGISSEFARLATIDMVSEISGGERADFLNTVYQQFLTGKRQYVELAAALGGIIFKPSFSGSTISIDFIQPNSFIPVSFDASGRLISAIFLDRITSSEGYFTRLEYHHPEKDGYFIENRAFKSSSLSDLGKEIPLSKVSAWSDIEPYTQIDGLDTPLFTYFKMPYSNTVDPYSPLGIPVFATACDLIRDADIQYSRLLWEFESGERALYLDRSAFTRDRNGNPLIPDKKLYRTISADENLFHDWSPSIRDESILRGLNSILRKIEFCCGLSFGTISDETLKDRTAEEIRASKQRSYATVCDIQIAFKNALSDLICCLDKFVSLYCLAPLGDYSVSFSFDDSIVADRKTEFQERLQLLNSGILLPHEFRMWYLGEDEATAKSTLKSMEESI